MVELKDAFRILLGRHGRKRLLGRPWHKWEGNIKMYPKEIIYKDVGGINLAPERV
jgi:hypothetical protein